MMINKFSLMIVLLVMLPNCGRLIDWGKSNFYQGEQLANFTYQVVPYIRSTTIYDQLETKAIFDVLWLNDVVRTTYAHLHALRQGSSQEKLQAFLRRQLEENNHYITFYILSTHDVQLGTPESQWSFFLEVDDHKYYPFELKEIDLPYEYQIFFGHKWNRFKVPYLLRFRAHNDEDLLFTEEVQNITLVARSAQKEHMFTWKTGQSLDKKATFTVPRAPKKSKKKGRT